MLHNHTTNGSAIVSNGGVVKAVDESPTTLRQVCLELQAKVDAFLAEDVDTPLLKSVQAQVKEAISVIDEALERYRYAPTYDVTPREDSHSLGHSLALSHTLSQPRRAFSIL